MEDPSELGPGHYKGISNLEQSTEKRMQTCERTGEALCSSCLSYRWEGPRECAGSGVSLQKDSPCFAVEAGVVKKRRWVIGKTDLESTKGLQNSLRRSGLQMAWRE